MRSNPWPSEVRQQVLAALRAGDTQEKIHRELGVPRKTLGNWARAAGLTVPRESMQGRFCLEDDCTESAKAKGYCSTHRHQKWRLRPVTEEDVTKAEQRLLDRSFPTVCGCRIWTGGIINPGNKWDCKYGAFTALGEVQVHRVAYRIAKGPIPEGMEVDHLCSVTLCVEAEHLEAVTKLENIRRTWARGRGANRAKMSALEFGKWMTAV